MESSSIEMTVRYCRDLKSFNFFQKQSLFATVAIRSDEISKKPENEQRQKTPNDEDGDGHPEWNHEVKFDIDEALFKDPDHIFFHFEVHANVTVLGDKIIGEAHVPLKDLVDERNGIVRFVNYELRGLDGKVNGMLTFSYKINRKGGATGAELGGIDGYSVVHQPPTEIHYPKVEVESDNPPLAIQYPSIESENSSTETDSKVQHTFREVHYPPSKVQQPSMESAHPSTETSAQVHHTSHVHYPQTKVHHPSIESANPSAGTPSQVQHTSREAHYQPQQHNVYYPPPPPSHHQLPPPPMFPHHPPPPHLVHGGFFHPPPPPPPPMFHWQFPNNHDSSRGLASDSRNFERSEMSNNGETWQNGVGTDRQRPHPSHRNYPF